TSVAQGIQAALNAIAADSNPPLSLSNRTPSPTPSPTAMPKGTYIPAVIILLTDGENNQNPDPLAVAQAAADRGVRIYTVGVGTACVAGAGGAGGRGGRSVSFVGRVCVVWLA